VFESQGYKIVSVTSGQQALDQVEQWEFAVVLLDLQMARMSGFETAQRMRERGGRAGHRRVDVSILEYR